MSKLRRRPEALPGWTISRDTSLGRIFVVSTYDGAGPAEVFVQAGKVGSDGYALAEAIGRLCSVLLRLEELGTPLERLELIIDQLEGIGSSRGYVSVPHAISEVLRDIKRNCEEVASASGAQLADAESE